MLQHTDSQPKASCYGIERGAIMLWMWSSVSF